MSTDANLRLDVREEAGRPTLAVITGPLDLHTAPSLHRQVTLILHQSPSLILVLTGVTYCDSSGLNTLLRLHLHAQDSGGRLTVAGPPAQLVRMLTVTGMDTVLPVYGTVAESQETYGPS
ncbi:STAS domain-containing protein [Streptomyces longwoodensis]|uniref:STAS domain-containing protein n=1 Tax=Streptomyces longwoodensis TaxID=68231 RepID=UPI0033F267C6